MGLFKKKVHKIKHPTRGMKYNTKDSVMSDRKRARKFSKEVS